MRITYSSDPEGKVPIDPKTAPLKVGDVIYLSMDGGKPTPSVVTQVPQN